LEIHDLFWGSRSEKRGGSLLLGILRVGSGRVRVPREKEGGKRGLTGDTGLAARWGCSGENSKLPQKLTRFRKKPWGRFYFREEIRGNLGGRCVGNRNPVVVGKVGGATWGGAIQGLITHHPRSEIGGLGLFVIVVMKYRHGAAEQSAEKGPFGRTPDIIRCFWGWFLRDIPVTQLKQFPSGRENGG